VSSHGLCCIIFSNFYPDFISSLLMQTELFTAQDNVYLMFTGKGAGGKLLINHITLIQKFSQYSYLGNLAASNVLLQPKINYVLCLDLLTSYFVVHATYFEVVQSDCVSEKSEFYYICRRYLLCCVCRQQLSVCEKIGKVLSQVNRTVT
jgi:hypothetical protein